MNVINYFKESIAEIKKVTWPTRKEAINHTLLVIGISLALAAFFGALDYLLTVGLQALLALKQ